MVDINSSELPQKNIQPLNKTRVVGLIIISILISSIITGLLFIVYFKYTDKSFYDKQVQNVNIKYTKESSNFTYLGMPEEVESVLQQIFTGKVSYSEKKDNVYYYTKSFDLTKEQKGYISLNITTYKYFQGAKYNDGYEGITYITNLDNVVNKISKFELGKQIGSVIMDEALHPGKYEIISKELGNNKYAIYDTTFLGGGVFRNYFSYNRETNQLIHFIVSMDYLEPKPEGKQECYDSKGETCIVVYQYPEALREMIDDFESVLSKY